MSNKRKGVTETVSHATINRTTSTNLTITGTEITNLLQLAVLQELNKHGLMPVDPSSVDLTFRIMDADMEIHQGRIQELRIECRHHEETQVPPITLSFSVVQK